MGEYDIVSGEAAQSMVGSNMAPLGVSNIILIGMPGAGKSTLGVVLAKILNKDFLDCDLVIQQHFGKTLQQLIDERGAEGFIACEGRVLKSIEVSNCVIATGGSAVYSPDALQHLAQSGPVVYLRVTLESLTARLGDLRERGVVMRRANLCNRGRSAGSIKDADIVSKSFENACAQSAYAAPIATNHNALEELYKERYYAYEHCADIIVDVDNLAISDAAAKVIAALECSGNEA